MKNIYDILGAGLGTDDSNVPITSKITQSSDNNLDHIEFLTTSNFELDNLEEFVFYDHNGNLIFRGVARDNGAGNTNSIMGFDYGFELQEILIRKNFEQLTPLEIIEDVITNFTSLTYNTPTGIIDGEIIKLYTSQNKTAKQIIDDMHKLLGTTN